MINSNDINNISSLLSKIIFYGFSNCYSELAIEEKIISNSFINNLENGDSSFLINYTDEQIIGSIFNRIINLDSSLISTNTLSLWLGDIYTELFFHFNKSFSFIFLYLPIKKGIDLFPIYHEMDINQVFSYFEKIIKKHNILSLLLKKKSITIGELSILSNINYNTLVSYTRNNEFIYNAKFDSVFKIAHILNVNINIFAKEINNYTNSFIFDLEDKPPLFLLYFALHLSSYYDKDLRDNSYMFQQGTLYNGKDIFAVKINKSLSNSNSLIELAKEYAKEQKEDVSITTFVILNFNNSFIDESTLLEIYKLGFRKTIVIDNCYFYEVYNGVFTRIEMDYKLLTNSYKIDISNTYKTNIL